MSLLKSLRDTANGAGEMIGKADIFATGGPMRRIADNLVTGLTQVKKTQFYFLFQFYFLLFFQKYF